MIKKPLLIIEWEDTCSQSGWEGEEGIKHAQNMHCMVVGWKVKSDKKFITLTSMRGEGGTCNDRVTVSRKSISSIRRVE